jgi:hypothetical protein
MPRSAFPGHLAACIVPLLALAAATAGADGIDSDAPPERRCLSAAPAGPGPMRVDGVLDEPAWAGAPVASDFIQREPVDGAPASLRTEVRVLHDAGALWVGVRALDPEPRSIVGRLTRRDEDSNSDWIIVMLDSYCDRRTAFDFRINPAGVKRDILISDDGDREDASWDAVWDAAARVDSAGWCAEFRIPTNQLRFEPGENRRFGFQAARWIHRLNESSFWSPCPRRESGLVSHFGDLVGMSLPAAPRRIQLLPYVRMSGLSHTVDGGDPFRDPSEFDGAGGVDAKIGLGGSLTLDATVNPDFGQVEADPSVLNLSAFETFYPEKRPFFMEGAQILRFGLGVGDGDGANESLFYSRRIGRRPQGEADADYVDVPGATSIISAAKLTGRTASGWSVGILDAVTAREVADVADDSTESRIAVEPLTNYLVARLRRDMRQGRTALGLIGTAVVRDIRDGELEFLRDRATTGGLDFHHRFAGDRYSLDGYFVGSAIHGASEAILKAQRAPQRYYQRPDAGYVEVDSARTSLTGTASSITLGKITGHWRAMTTANHRSPGFDSNDLGYLRIADQIQHSLWIGYREWEPGPLLLSYNVNWNYWNAWTWGGDPVNRGGNINGFCQFRNYWYSYAGINVEPSRLEPRALRGGPSVRTPSSGNVWLGVGSDDRKPVSFELEGWIWRDVAESRSFGVHPVIAVRPSPRWQVSVRPSYENQIDDWGWVTSDDIGDDRHYVLARLEQETISLTARLNYAFTPDLSLQFYAQPFFAAGRYRGMKRVTDPRAADYDDLMTPYGPEEIRLEGGVYTVTTDDGEFSFDNPDFNFAELRSNLILRWEFRPGSALFLVWTQGRIDDPLKDGRVSLSRDASDLFAADSENVLLAKVTYWLPL